MIRKFGIWDWDLRVGWNKWLIWFILYCCATHFGYIFLSLYGEWILWCIAFMIDKDCSIASVVVNLVYTGLRFVPLIRSFWRSNDWRCICNAKWPSKKFLTISWKHLEHEWARSLAVGNRWTWILRVQSYRHMIEHIILLFRGSNIHVFYLHLWAFFIDLFFNNLAGIRKIQLRFRIVTVRILIAHRFLSRLFAFLLFLD